MSFSKGIEGPAIASISGAGVSWFIHQANEIASLLAALIAIVAGCLAIYRHFKK